MDRLVSQISNALVLYATDAKMLKLEDNYSTDDFSETEDNSFSDGEIFNPQVKPTRPALLCRRRTISGPQGQFKKM